MDWRLFNVILLGIAFMLLFTAFQTCSMVEETVLKGARDEPNSTFTGSGYTSLAIIYGVFAGSNWFAPSVVAVCGPKISMIIGGAFYCLFIFSFLKPMTWALYLGSVLVGFGAAILWTAQGNFITLNSDADTMGRNSGIFWALLQLSLLIGNFYTYFAFGGQIEIDHTTRMTLFIILTSVGVVGVLVMFAFKSGITNQAENNVNTAHRQEAPGSGPIEALKKSVRLMCTKDMILLSFSFAYTGFELTFWSGVFGTSVGATGYFGTEAKSLIGLIGVFVGIGEVFGGGLFGLMGKRTNQFGRDPIVLLGFISHVVASYLVFLSLPQDSPLVSISTKSTYIMPNKYVILVCAFLLGFGDSSFNTQIFSLLGSKYPDESAPAFAVFKFLQSLASAVAFVYSDYLLLKWQLLIMVVFSTLGTLGFCLVEWSSKQLELGYPQVTMETSLLQEDEDDDYDGN